MITSVSAIIELGDDNQKRSNDDEDFYVEVDSTFTIQNLGADNWTGINIAFDGDAKYNLSFTNYPDTLAVGTTAVIVTVTAKVPEDLAAVDEDGNLIAVDIGNAVITYDNGSAQIMKEPITMQAENMLFIDKFEVAINGKSSDNYDEDDDKIKDIKPGDEIEITVKVENKFDGKDEEDLDIDDVDVDLFTDDGDIDIDESETIDVGADSTEEYVFEIIELDYDIDSNSDLTIKVVGEDDNGARHGQTFILTMDINKDREDIVIREFEDLIAITCNTETFDLDFTLINIGSTDESDVEVKVSSTDLEYNDRQKDIELDEGDDEDIHFTITVPASLTSGNKQLKVTTYYDRIKESNEEIITVTVPRCDEPVTPPPVVDNGGEEGSADETEVIFVDNSDVSDIESDGVIVASDVSTSTESVFGSKALVIVLIVVAILALAAIGVSVALLVQMKKKQ